MAVSVLLGHQKTLSVRRSVIESPRRSTIRRTSIMGLSRRSLQRILHGELNFHPYKITIVQKLLPSDFVQRRLFCERMLQIIASDDVISIWMVMSISKTVDFGLGWLCQ